MKLLQHFSEVSQNYDALLCDVWGVVHNGREPAPGVVPCLERFRRQGGVVILLTNAPRPSSIIPAQLEQIGVSAETYDAIVTSGDATRHEIERRAPGRVLHIGPPRDLGLFDAAKIALVERPEEADFVLCSGLYDDTTETAEDYRSILSALRAHGLDMICANPDIEVVRGSQRVYCAGAIAEAYQAVGGSVVYCGKPHNPIYDLALLELNEVRQGVARERILAIGDGPATDIEGANLQGLDALFVAGGLYGQALSSGPTGDLQRSVERLLNRQGVSAKYLMQRLIH